MSSMKDDQEYREQIRLKAKNDFNQDLTDSQIDMCIYTEEQEKLSFFHGHLYINPRRMQVDGKWMNKVQWSKSIDGYRVLAQRNGLCRVDEPVWQSDKEGALFCCKVSVWRRGPDGYPEGPFVGIAHYHEYVQMVDDYENGRKTGKKRPNRQWQTSPMNQLAICAERQAHRKAGLDHTQMSEDIVDIQPRDTIDEPIDAEVEPYEQGTRDAEEEHGKEEAKAKAQQAPSMEYEGAHRGKVYRGSMIVGTTNGPGWHGIFLDNGKKVVFKREGTKLFEQETSDREDENPGGWEWEEGAAYYDGSRVIGVTVKGRVAVLELDSGFKVKLDPWGKEVGRKELEKPQAEAPKGDAPHEGQRSVPEEEDATPKGDTEFAKALLLAEDCSGASTEDMRKSMIVLLAFWCKNFNGGIKISPKSAYIKLVGVAIAENDKMREEDYRALLETLAEKIKEKAA